MQKFVMNWIMMQFTFPSHERVWLYVYPFRAQYIEYIQ